MLKKIAIAVALFIIPLGAMAQKLGHVNSEEIMAQMPEYQTAQSELEALQKQYQEEYTRSGEEYTKKVQEYQEQADSLPQNIAERRVKELQDMQQRLNDFQQEASNAINQAIQDKLGPIRTKITNAIKAIGDSEGYTYIIDEAANAQLPVIAYFGSGSTDLTAKVKNQLGIQ